MKKYEIVFVLHADEPESEMEERVKKVESMVSAHNGEITERNHWGGRKLAYEIQHETRGNYMHLRFRCDGTVVEEMDNEFRLDHKVLRHLVVVDEEWKERNAASRTRRRSTEPAAASTTPGATAAPAGDK